MGLYVLQATAQWHRRLSYLTDNKALGDNTFALDR